MKLSYLSISSIIFMVILAIQPAQANPQKTWMLSNDQSDVNFVSIKNNKISESHYFKSLKGSMDSNGAVKVVIALGSVETGIDIRNDRMKSMLFDVAAHGEAIISAQLTKDQLTSLASKKPQRMTLMASLELHGKTSELQLEVTALQSSSGQLLVASAKPIVINADQFGLAQGIKALQEVAGLSSIGLSVPVTFQLVFEN